MDILDSLASWADNIRQEVLSNGFATAFKNHVSELAEQSHLNPSKLAAYVEDWLRADPATAKFLDHPIPPPPADSRRWFDKTVQRDRQPDAPLRGVVERDGHPVKVYRNEQFSNWGATVHNVPSYTFVPRTKRGVINTVRFALANNLRVRVAGSRHTWTNLYARTGDVVISMLELDAATARHKFAMPDENPQDNELEAIRFEGTRVTTDGREVGLVRLGAAATSDHFRQWALSPSGGDWKWMLPALPILVSITSAGWTQVMCHGAGISHQTVSDLCVEVEIVNCRGKLQTISDPEQMRAVSGSFGLLGVIVSHVFILDPLQLANFHPRKIPTPLAIPPVSRRDVPASADDFDFDDHSEGDLERARIKFELDAKKFYSEWFWFPFQKNCWVNCWDTSPPTGQRPRYPDEREVRIQNTQMALARIFEVTLLRALPPKWQAELMGFAAMKLLPGDQTFATSVPDALHFQRGIHRLPVRDCEIEIEIPAKRDGSPDFSIVQRAWWMGIKAVYDALPAVPMRTTLEMRIVGNSDVTLSTQRHNDCGTCSIEVLTNTLVDDAEWAKFIEDLTARWASLNNPVTGEPLRVKPHFAKEWPQTIRGLEIGQYLKEVNKTEIVEFKRQLAAASSDGGYYLWQALEMFGNDTILDMIGEPRF